MKKKLLITLILCLLLGMIVPVQASAASKPKLNKTKVSLVAGKTYKLTVKGTKKKVTWKTSNKKVATVSSKGKVTAKKAGTAKITAKVGKQTLKCTVKVTAKKTSSKTTTNKWGAKVVIPATMGDWLQPLNRAKITKVTFRADTSPSSKYYLMECKFKITQLGVPTRGNWGANVYFYNKKGKKIGYTFLYASPLKKGKTYKDSADVPKETAKIVFMKDEKK